MPHTLACGGQDAYRREHVETPADVRRNVERRDVLTARDGAERSLLWSSDEDESLLGFRIAERRDVGRTHVVQRVKPRIAFTPRVLEQIPLRCTQCGPQCDGSSGRSRKPSVLV
jgi:hypothetical protein